MKVVWTREYPWFKSRYRNRIWLRASGRCWMHIDFHSASSMRIRNTRFRVVPDQNGPQQSAFCRTGKKDDGERPDGRGFPTSQQATQESPTEGFSVGLMECTSGADSPLRKGVVCPIHTRAISKVV